ncbi:GGDEF domain-containing protein [Salaquimonas pukyongi]|uniref:GGDEF domain-containing protein n=1 Tax=Salaquimonas pukyongi TaxID=2712698 RepID=UPI0009F9C949|nr:GGDEF domain-containing protein [Salaquimonas pukyongi]
MSTVSQNLNFCDSISDRNASSLLCDYKEYFLISSISRKVLEISHKQKTPLIPIVYDIWYNYLKGENQALVRHINQFIESKKPLSLMDLDHIHSEFLDTPDLREKQIADATSSLGGEVTDVLTVIDSHLSKCGDYSESLRETTDTLHKADGLDDIKKAVDCLVSHSESIQSDTEQLRSALNRSREEIESLQEALDEARRNELIDPLTNIANRRALERRLEEMTGSQRSADRDFCVIIADIDHFKSINDGHGHLIGDEVLRYFAGLIHKNVRKEDLAARYGGEEFAIILVGCSVEEAHKRAEIMRSELEKVKLVIKDTKQEVGKITASFGIARYREGDDHLSVLGRADENLYKAKQSGRNRVAA